MWKFVPVTTKEGELLAGEYRPDMPDDSLFPISIHEFASLVEAEPENFTMSFEALPTEEPSSRNVAYCYSDKVIMMTKDEFFKEVDFS